MMRRSLHASIGTCLGYNRTLECNEFERCAQLWAEMEKQEERVRDARQIYIKGDAACPQ